MSIIVNKDRTHLETLTFRLLSDIKNKNNQYVEREVYAISERY